jgi:hypothetical protein
MAAALAKHGEHQVGGTVDYLWNVGIAGLRKGEPAQTMTAHHPIEIAIECLHQRSQQIQPTQLRGLLAGREIAGLATAPFANLG